MVELKLKCRCTDGEASLSVRKREEAEDILAWMDYVREEVGRWHSIRQCSEAELEYLKVPIKDGRVG